MDKLHPLLKTGTKRTKSCRAVWDSQNTSFRWRHRFLTNANDIKTNELFGIVEMNSMLMIKSYEGSKSMPRKARKRGLNIEKKLSTEQFSVFFSRNRESYIYDKIFDYVCNIKKISS